MSENAISFREIPKTTRLFQDFLYNFDNVSQFYQPDGHNGTSLLERAKRIASESFPRAEVADILTDQNRAAGAGEATLLNLERLRQPDSVVVITGQQAGLFSGPLFTVYKALTVVKLAEKLRAEGANAVPLFWIASEDHDLAEVNHCRVVDRDGHLTTISYTACPTKDGKPVGNIRLCEEINQRISDLIAALPESEFVTQIEADLRAAYAPGVGFAEAFGKLVMTLLGKFGLVMIDPLDDRLKQIAGTIYSEAISRTPELAATLVAESQKLEAAGYHAQVFTSAESVPLFMMDEGRRTALQRSEDGFYFLKTSEKKEQKMAAEEIFESVKRCPSCFSPNVTLRPIVQDFLLPTVAYVGGPAEVAYFAQLRPVYRLLGRIEPVIIPRASFTIVEKRQAKTLQKQQLKFTDIFAGQQEVTAKIVERGLDADTAAVFDETEKIFQDQLEKLRDLLTKADPTLADALKGGREKILHQIAGLKSRFIHNRSKRDETMLQQVERLFSLLYPNKSLQEREINVTYFLARYGHNLFDWLYAEVDPDNSDHKLIYL